MQGFKEKKKLISLIVIQYIFCISLSLDMEVTRGLSDFSGCCQFPWLPGTTSTLLWLDFQHRWGKNVEKCRSLHDEKETKTWPTPAEEKLQSAIDLSSNTLFFLCSWPASLGKFCDAKYTRFWLWERPIYWRTLYKNTILYERVTDFCCDFMELLSNVTSTVLFPDA